MSSGRKRQETNASCSCTKELTRSCLRGARAHSESSKSSEGDDGRKRKHLLQKIMSGWVYAGARVQSGAGHVPTRSQSTVERVEIRTAFHEHPAICHDKSDDWVRLSNSAPILVQNFTTQKTALTRRSTAMSRWERFSILRNTRASVSIWKKSFKRLCMIFCSLNS